MTRATRSAPRRTPGRRPLPPSASKRGDAHEQQRHVGQRDRSRARVNRPLGMKRAVGSGSASGRLRAMKCSAIATDRRDAADRQRRRQQPAHARAPPNDGGSAMRRTACGAVLRRSRLRRTPRPRARHCRAIVARHSPNALEVPAARRVDEQPLQRRLLRDRRRASRGAADRALRARRCERHAPRRRRRCARAPREAVRRRRRAGR